MKSHRVKKDNYKKVGINFKTLSPCITPIHNEHLSITGDVHTCSYILLETMYL